MKKEYIEYLERQRYYIKSLYILSIIGALVSFGGAILFVLGSLGLV